MFKFPRKNNCRRRGVTLLITMMVVIVLASVIVQFQSDTSLQLRADRYRLDMIQCRYAAESSLVSTPLLVKAVLEAKSQADQTAATNPTPTTVTDPNTQGNTTEQNDPNATTPKPKPYIIATETMEIGQVKVEISLHDESGKWPVVWLFHPPYEPSLGSDMDINQAFESFALAMKLDGQQAIDAAALIRKTGEGLDIPLPTYVLQKREVQDKTGTTALFKAVRQSEEDSQPEQGQGGDGDKTKNKTKMLSTFASRWYNACRTSEYGWLTAIPQGREDCFADNLNVWSSDKINITTASAEVLAGAFGPLGLTYDMANAIVLYRQNNPMTTVSALSNIGGVPVSIAQSIQILCVTSGETYSVHVTATLGRAKCTLIGGFYLDENQQLKIAAAIPGD